MLIYKWNKLYETEHLLPLDFSGHFFCLREKQGWGATTWRAAAILSTDFKFLRVAGTPQIYSWVSGRTPVKRVENQFKLCLRNSTSRKIYFKNWSHVSLPSPQKILTMCIVCIAGQCIRLLSSLASLRCSESEDWPVVVTHSSEPHDYNNLSWNEKVPDTR